MLWVSGVYVVLLENKKSGRLAGFFVSNAEFMNPDAYQKSSNCENSIGAFLSFFSVKSSIDPNCLSVIDKIPT